VNVRQMPMDFLYVVMVDTFWSAESKKESARAATWENKLYI